MTILTEETKAKIESKIKARFPELPDDIIYMAIDAKMNPGSAGHFYRAIVNGDLANAVCHADSKNLKHLGSIGLLFHREHDCFNAD
jgi:hypothetical protein